MTLIRPLNRAKTASRTTRRRATGWDDHSGVIEGPRAEVPVANTIRYLDVPAFGLRNAGYGAQAECGARPSGRCVDTSKTDT